MPFIPVAGVNIKTKPWPGRRWLTRAMEKMKEVEKGRGVEELACFVGILEGYKARPMEKVVSSVTPRTEDWTVALPKRRMLEELKLVLKMNSAAEVKLRSRRRIVERRRGRGGRDITLPSPRRERERERVLHSTK